MGITGWVDVGVIRWISGSMEVDWKKNKIKVYYNFNLYKGNN